MGSFSQQLRDLARRPTAAALIFALALAGAEFWLWGFEDAGRPRAGATGARDLAFIVFGFAALFLFVRSMLVSRFGWQCVYFALFALALSVEYGFYGALGRFTLPSDLENTFYASDASDKYGAVTLFFNWLVVVPVVAFRLLFRFSDDQKRRGGRHLLAVLLMFFGGFYLLADFYRPPLPVNAFAAHYNNLTVSALYFAEKKFVLHQRIEPPPLVRAAPANNVVLIVDESVRADHLSVNGYERATTPTLDRLAAAGLLVNWRFASSGATESVGSNRLLLTGLKELPDRERRLKTLPTIFQYARAAGYRTFYFDGQDYSEWIGREEDRRDFGRIFTADDFPGIEPYALDRAFASKIREIVSGSRGNFIWVNKRGVHFRYEKNYPPEAAVWTPTDVTAGAAERASGGPLANNYDNAVRYNSASFFDALAGDELPAGTIYIYTADHGQTLRDGRATHAGDSREEALVPLLMIGRDARLAAADTHYRAAHRNIFATILDLMDYPVELRVADYAPSLLRAKAAESTPRGYFVGNLSGAFGGKKMPFDAGASE